MLKANNYIIIYSILIVLTARTSFYSWYQVIDTEYCKREYIFTDSPEDNMIILIQFFKLQRYSFLFDNILFVFTYVFILNTNLFWDIIFCEKMKKLYDCRHSLDSGNEIREVEYSYFIACKQLQQKKRLHKILIRFYFFCGILTFLF